jgi:hypothetical protein
MGANLDLANAITPPILTVVLVWISLLIGRLIQSGPLWWMLQAPKFLTGRERSMTTLKKRLISA